MPLTAVPRTLLTLLVGVAATLLAAPAAFVIAKARPDSQVVEKLIHWWARTWLAAAGVKVEVEGADNIDPGTSYVVVANHLSALDIMVCFMAIPLPIRYLAKKELFRIPILAPAMRAVGIIEVDRQARGMALDAINRQAQAVIARGHSLIIYPEGTRSRTGELRPFKKGAFTMALMAKMPVLPVTIYGTYQAWPPGTWFIRGGPVRVIIDPPIPTEGLGRSDAERMRDEARAVIERRFEKLRSESLSV